MNLVAMKEVRKGSKMDEKRERRLVDLKVGLKEVELVENLVDWLVVDWDRN